VAGAVALVSAVLMRKERLFMKKSTGGCLILSLRALCVEIFLFQCRIRLHELEFDKVI
jgi:hypothetical protein